MYSLLVWQHQLVLEQLVLEQQVQHLVQLPECPLQEPVGLLQEQQQQALEPVYQQVLVGLPQQVPEQPL